MADPMTEAQAREALEHIQDEMNDASEMWGSTNSFACLERVRTLDDKRRAALDTYGDAVRREALAEAQRTVSDDGLAISCQTLGQYRAWLLATLRAMSGTPKE